MHVSQKAFAPDFIPNWLSAFSLAPPICAIWNSSFRDSYVPELWKSADAREEIMEHIEDLLDPHQFGSQKGSSSLRSRRASPQLVNCFREAWYCGMCTLA